MASEHLTHAGAPGASSISRAEMLDPTHAAELRLVLPFGIPALIGAGASMVTCYSTILASAILGIPKLGLNPHVQAVLMWGFGLFALYPLWHDRKQHHSNVPAVLGAALSS